MKSTKETKLQEKKITEKTNVQKIKETIEELRPFLNMEGGDVEFIKYDEENRTVYVKMLGACAMCIAQDETLEIGLLDAIKDKVPEVENIINTPL